MEIRWKEYRTLRSAGECYSALLRIAEIFGSLGSLEPKERETQQKRCEEVVLDESELERIEKEFKEKEGKLSRILSVGNKWNEDEWLLVITIRIQNDLLQSYLFHRGYRFSTCEICPRAEILKQASLSPANQRAFDTALRMARRNWGLPIKHPLLDA